MPVGLRTQELLQDLDKTIQATTVKATAQITSAPIEPRRQLSLKIPRVEVRLYRSSHTSCDTIKKPPHFVYILNCEWAPFENPTPDEGPRYWWDDLPKTYQLTRRWIDFVRFHEVLKNDLEYDAVNGCRRVKSHVPDLPDKGELDKFVTNVAATGDALALTRMQKGEVPVATSDKRQALTAQELDDIHYIYVEKRLAPYFDEVNKVLAELPTELLCDCAALRKLVTDGKNCKLPSNKLVRERFCGPAPMSSDKADIVAAVKRMNKTHGGSFFRSGTPEKNAEANDRSRGARGGAQSRGAPASPAPPMSPSGASMASPSQMRSPPGGGYGNSPGSLLEKSPSAPSMSGSSPGSPPPGFDQSPNSTRRDERLASSHYGFFARSMPKGQDLGTDSTRDFWKRMAAKERRELGRRTMWLTAEEPAWRSFTPERLPALHPPGLNDQFRMSVEGGSKHGLLDMRRRSSTRLKEAMMTSKVEDRMAQRQMRLEGAIRDICDGLRVVVLGDLPSSMPRNLRKNEPIDERPDANKEETIKVYKIYRLLLKMAVVGAEGCVDDSSEEEDGDGSINGDSRQNMHVSTPEEAELWSSKGLPAVNWTAMFAWAQQKEDFAGDFRYRSVCAALNRAFKDWHQLQPNPAERQIGTPLNQLFEWIWPNVSADHIAAMLTWICLMEIDKFRQPTPPVIEPQERRTLEKIFNIMDPDSKGGVTPEDLAGGRDQGIDAKLKNIVDKETVIAVCGEREIQQIEFLELMCESAKRAHVDAIHVDLGDGRRLVRQTRKVIGIDIWVLQDVPPEEESQRRLVDAIEAEIQRWRKQAGKQARVAPVAPLWTGDVVS